MGRLQRKKTSRSKKKKKKRAGTRPLAEVRTENDTGGNNTAVADDTIKANPPIQAVAPKKQYATSSIAPAQPRDNFFNSAIRFLREVKIELKKVTWPSRKQTLSSTLVVLALVMLISLFLGVVDIGLSSLIRVVLR